MFNFALSRETERCLYRPFWKLNCAAAFAKGRTEIFNHKKYMAHYLRLLVFALLLLPFTMYGEGSKQLTPNKSTATLTSTLNDKAGYLAHDANFPSATGVAITSLSFLKPYGFTRNGSAYSDDHRLTIRVKAGEYLLYGVHRTIHDQTTANQADLVLTVRRPSATDPAGIIVQQTTLTRNQNSTRHMLLNTNQAGVIDDASQSSIGPSYTWSGVARNTGGYQPLIITNNTGADQDYWVEFTQVGESSWTDDGRRFSVYDFWDFTVIDGTGVERQGRMRSKLWSFSAGGTSNVFSKDFNMFPLIPSADQPGKFFVKKIELAGIAPQNFFRFVTNSFGSTTAAGSTYTARRKSQLSQTDYPEYANFVTNPDPSIWPSADAPTFTVGISSSCNTATGGGKSVFNLNTTESSTFVVLINLNGVDGYQAGTADVLLESTGAKGARTVEWNGLNGLGQVVARNTTLNYFFRNNSAAVHFPVWDAEANADGFRVEDVRPVAGSNYNALLFWDDSNLPTTSFPAPQTELFGVVSTAGVHRWGSASTTAGDLKTVNTWTYGYTASTTQSATFNYDCSADVAVTNTAATAPYTIGKSFTYTVTVTNNGPIAASNVQVTDKLDATKLEFVSSSDATNYSPSTGVWNVGSLAIGASKTLTITAKPLVLGTISATATQTHTEPDNVASNNSATATITVQAAADIEVKNVSDKTAYNNGELVTYTVTAKNLGPNTATGVVVTDKLPAGLTLEGAAPAGYDAATGAWTVGSLALNETKTLTLVARTLTSGSITTTASLGSRTGFELDENSNNNTASTTITVAPSADVAVTSTVSVSNPGQNEEVMFTIKVLNNGPNNASTVSVANQIPAGLTITSASASLGTFNASTGVWTVGTVATGATQTLTVYAKAANTGTYTLSSTQTHAEFDNQSSNNTASSTITVKATADVAVTNTVTPSAGSTYANGETVTYTVQVTNNGPSAATNVVVTDNLPASLTYNSRTISTGTSTFDATTGNLTWNVGTLASGATATMTISATINQSAVITTTATQTHTEYDNVSSNNSASNSIRSGSGVVTADIAVAVSTPKTDYYTKEPIPFKIVVSNAGPDAATNVTIAAALPAGFTFTGTSGTVGTYTNGVWEIPSLAAGTTAELIVTGTPNVDASVTGDKTYTFTASRTGTPAQTDNVSSNNSASTAVVVRKTAEVSTFLTVTSNDPSGNYYHNLTEATFRMTVTNNGPDVATDLQGMDTRTGTITFIPSSLFVPAGTTYSMATGMWHVGTLAVGESKTLELKGIPNANGRLFLGGGITNQTHYDPITENNRAVALLNVLPVAELAVTNTAASPTFYNGQETSFTVKVQNNGPDAATGVVIEDKLPAGLTFVSATASSGSYDATTGRWTLGSDLLPGAANAQTLVITVKPQMATAYSTTAAVVASNQYDNIASNNSQTASIQGSATADIALSSNVASGPYYVGGQYLVSITASNLGPDPATGVVLAAGVAPGLKLVPGSSVTPAGTSIDIATGLWIIGNMGVNESKTITLLVEPTTIGVLNSLGYKYTANEFDPNGGNTQNGNNSTVVHITSVDREATYTSLFTSKHMFALKSGDHIAEASDPDGVILNARVINGALPAGLRFGTNGELEVDKRFALVPGTYTLTIETSDAVGGVSESTVTFTISNDWDNDGVPDAQDLDANNDGVFNPRLDSATSPLGDADNDGIPNFLDIDFVHPVFGVFQDKNNDEANDAFDLDLDGLINEFDIDIDGDGIPNAVEANRGIVPSSTLYDAAAGIFKGAVSANGIPVTAQTANNSGVSILPNPDSDADGQQDYEDLDADNDGISDNLEAQATARYVFRSGSDSDFDGLNDAYDPTTGGIAIVPIDTDKDKTPDYLDRDSDNDLSEDYVEAFDDNGNGMSLDDLKARATLFEELNGKGWYVNSDMGTGTVPNWLKLKDGYPAFLNKSSSYYHDSDHDGLVDLFDTDNGGHTVSMQTGSDNEYAFRSSSATTVLPVTLVSFEAKSQAQGVLLSWVTASEKENDYFLVERSADGRNFSTVGKVAGNGTTNQKMSYSLLDKSAFTGTAYYRLKQVDYDGKYEYSKVISVKATAVPVAQVKVSFYPNPTSDVVNLDLTAVTAARVTITVHALDGRLVETQEVPGASVQKLDLSKVAVGTYLIKVRSAATDTTLKVIKR